LHPARRQGLEHVNEVWRIAEAKLGKGDWVLRAYSIVDIHLFRLFWRMERSLKPAPGTLPNLFRHYERMLIRPAVKRTNEIESATGYQLPA
jgi:glutathione S-transferase